MSVTKKALVLFPHQLFDAVHLPEVDTIYLVEEPLIFGTDDQYPVCMHVQKLILHRASMRRYYQEMLWPAGYEVKYIEDQDGLRTEHIIARVAVDGHADIFVFDPVDYEINRRLRIAQSQVDKAVRITILETPNFLLDRLEAGEYFAGKHEHLFADFYKWQRERFNILLTKNYKPIGGKWSFDNDNRHKLRKDIDLPDIDAYGDNEYVKEARHYVQTRFGHLNGSDEDFIWPTNHAESAAWLDEFILERLDRFGTYQDAVEPDKPFMYHSVISPMLNIGLLSPKQVIDAVIDAYEKRSLRLESVEGFLRQVLGWREFVRGIYEHNGVAMRTGNYFENSRRLTDHWYRGDTGLVPVDDAIRKTKQFGYMHHIERLMVVSNAMLLSDIHPDAVYQWFMEMSIDAYDWVMVPNVYGMGQYADGGKMVTKPYVSGSNYIHKMSHYEKSGWSETWDGLYWSFLKRHRSKLKTNPRLGLALGSLDRMSPDKLRILEYRAGDFLASRTTRHDNK
ncbi:MAG: cryptochrome/photolyase family protein [Patescibacteria group bacterium]